jgi:hypothetical protein
MPEKAATAMLGLLKKITVRRRPQKQQTLRKQAERILQHDQLLLARVPGGRDGVATAIRTATPEAEAQPHKQLTYFGPGIGEATTPAALPANFDDELRRLSRLMDLDD